MQFWIQSYTEMNIVRNLQLMKPGNTFFLYTFLLCILGFLYLSSGLKTRTSINGFNAIRQKRDLLTAEDNGDPFSGARRLLTESHISKTESCSQGCLNGALCTEAGSCDCETFQAQGDRCQYVPNTGKERDAICKSWGQYNFETFDGIYFYFPGNCSYIFARDCSNPVPLYTIWVHNSPKCEGSVYNCPRSISMFFSSQEEITVSGYEVRKGGMRLLLPQTVENVFIERLADYILVKTTFGFSLAWDGGSGIYIKLTEDHRGKPCGLCGNFNGNWSDDLIIQHTEETTEDIALFANSWYIQIPDETICVPTVSEYPNPCSQESVHEAMFLKCQVLLQFPFLSCHETIDPYSFIASCMNDLCKQDDEETYCRVVMEYARACSHSGFPIRDWRDDFPACTEKCENNFVHRDCISCCPPTCTYEKECLGSNLHCLDGCYCPEGLILDNGSCVSVTSCPCIYHGTAYPAGSKIEQECSMCICTGGVWNCTEHECPSECSVVGDSHFTTFDGRYFTFLGLCQYILVKGIGKDKFTVTLQKSSCEQHSDHTCIQSITLVLDEDINKQITILRNGEVQFGSNQGIILNGDIEVRNLSSMFVQLKTKFGIRIQFAKGGDRLYIQANSSWKRRTLGLCGTFNGNLRDDFLSPAGMIEGTPQLHANAWKISSACLTPVNIPVIDPCDTNLQNVGYATNCDVINQELFAPCHAYVSPGLYYQLCRFDACKCGSTCLCNALAHYAYICNKHGVSINFRSQVSFCGVICRYGMLYHQCSSYCGRTCYSLSLGEVCTDECIEGCNCPDGKYFDESLSFCVPISSCRCYFKGRIYHPGEVILRQSGSCQCLNGTMRCTETSTTITGHTCPEGKLYFDCRNPILGLPSAGVNCEVTCANLAMNFTCVPSPPCASGCICPPGMAEHKGKCYVPDSCPCTWKDWEYLSGEVISTPCYTCVCKRGIFNCTSYPCPSVCTVYGDRHYFTFDGLEYDYVSDCQAFLVKSTDNSNVSIISQNKKCFDNDIICSKNLIISVSGKEIYFSDTPEKQRQFRLQYGPQRYQHWKAGFYTVVHFPELDITILWDKKTTIHVKVGPRWKGKLSGLCGNFDKYTSNDLTTSNNMEVRNAQVFGDSWTIGQCKSSNETMRPCEVHQSKFPYAKKECSILYSDVFAPCRNVIDVTSFVKNCHTDTCNCYLGGDCECLCTSIAAYAHKCCQQGVVVHWRSPNMCPYDCEYYNQGLGEGPFILSSCGNSEIVLGVNVTSKYIFPLPRMSAHGNVLFNFMITPGLFRDKDRSLSLVSLESAERPNYFLSVEENDSVRLEQWEASPTFQRRATFFHHQGLWIPGYSAFELHSKKGFFIVLTATEVKVSKYDNSEEFKLSSGFKIEEIAAAVPYRRMCEWRYEPCSSPCVKTCSDPEATLCTFLPPVEGCIPYCPNHMILDEVTLKCVYKEDCVPVKSTVLPFTTKPTKTSPASTASSTTEKYPTMTSLTSTDFSDTPTSSTIQSYSERKTTLQAHLRSSTPSTADKYESPFELLTSGYDKTTVTTYSTDTAQQTTKKITPETREGSTTSKIFTSSIKRTTSPQTVTSFATLKTIPPREVVDTTKTPTRMLGQLSQGLFQLTTRAVTVLLYSSVPESTVSPVAKDTSGLPMILNVSSPVETSTPSVSLTSYVVTSPLSTAVKQVPSTSSSTTTSKELQSSQTPQTTFKITDGKPLTSIILHTSLINETVPLFPTNTTGISISGNETSVLTSPSIHLSPALTRIHTTPISTSTSIPDLHQTTKSITQTNLEEELSILSTKEYTSEKALVASTPETTVSVTTYPPTISVTTEPFSSTLLSTLTLPLQNTTSITDKGATLDYLKSTESAKPTVTATTKDLTKTSLKPTTLSTTNATFIQTPPVTLSTKKFPKSTEPSIKTLTTLKEHLGTSMPTQEAPTSTLERRSTDHPISTTQASSSISPFVKPEGTIKVTMPSIESSTSFPRDSLFTTLPPSVTFDTSSHSYGKVTDSTTSHLDKYSTAMSSTKHLETPAELTTKTATTETSGFLSTLGTINETTLNVTVFKETTHTVYGTHSLSTIKEMASTASVETVTQSTMGMTQPAYTSLVTIKTLTDSAPLETLEPTSNVTKLKQLGTTLSIHTLSDSSVLPSTTEPISSETATEFMGNLTASADYYSFGTMVHTSSSSECMPRYIEPLDPCSQYVCINMGWMLYNVSSNCHKNVEKPDCGFRGMPVQVNSDSCCPEWECPCQCSVLSELSIITFDGNNIALYNAAPYILVRLPKETIVAHIEKCPPSLSVNSIRKLVAAGGTSGLCFKKLNVTTANFQLLINRLERRVEVNSVLQPLPFSKQGLCIQDTGAMYVINTPAGISIKWTHVTGIIDIQYGLHSNQSTKTEGLCGICNGDPSDDLKMQNRTIITNKEDIEAFIKSWEIEKSIDVTTRRPLRNCTEDNCTYCMELLNRKVFVPCHRKVSPQDFCEKMWINSTYFLNYECDALSAYVALCSKHNICIRWRTQDYCSLPCPEGKEYQACVQPCAAKTCLNKWYYEESPCSYLREDCVCKKGTILHRTDSELCIPEQKCACTDNEGHPHSPGEIWHSSANKCCLSKCLENGTVVSVEPNCSEQPDPICNREGEVLIRVIEEGACCPKKVCDCNTTLCEKTITCKSGERLVAEYSPVTCCPQLHCVCDPSACPVVTQPECRQDQILVQVRQEDSCCFSYICVCESCTEPVAVCTDEEILTVDLNTTNQCCPRYICVCDEKLCPSPQLNCSFESQLVKKTSDGKCCPDWYCECNCGNETLKECALGEFRRIDTDRQSPCGCSHYICEKEEVCVYMGITLLQPGQVLVEYLNGKTCYTVKCLHEKDPATGFYAMETLMVNCSKNCAPNQLYVPSSNHQMCCGTCKNVSCTFYSHNETFTIYEVGDSWISNCTKYECTKTAVGAMVLGSSVVCPPFNSSECLKNGGTIQTYNDGCCKICSKEEKICQKVSVRTTIRKSDCFSQYPITVASCDGKCPSATIFNVNIDSHIRFCKCCRENGVQNFTVPLYCSGNGTEVMYVIQEPLDCSCQWN
ncbi:otogelin-like protein isoform X1 [Hyla sarda]|uniref:otogelin-like protein isoform X1 n=2 Tax=Hyla sarda TaxID=327740 RepID=UPI0024C2EB1E|nr:otogelin-like protein isoform X1 [Hyla sarda]